MILNGKDIGNLFLAPMAGITDAPFRSICIDYGAQLTYTEMISAKALYYKDQKTEKLLEKIDSKEPLAIHIFGSDEKALAYAAEYASELNPVLIDINMGCPVTKVVKNYEGSALMKDIKKAMSVASTVVKHSSVPVSVKFRAGFDKNSINYIDFGKAMEAAGAACITLHPRTRDMYYSGNADWSMIKALKDVVSIPVIANGDVFKHEDIQAIKDATGCDDVMIARGSMGNPWIFSKHLPSLEERIEVFIRHMDLSIEFAGEYRAILEMRKHGAWYFKGLANSAKFRDLIFKTENRQDVINCIQESFF